MRDGTKTRTKNSAVFSQTCCSPRIWDPDSFPSMEVNEKWQVDQYRDHGTLLYWFACDSIPILFRYWSDVLPPYVCISWHFKPPNGSTDHQTFALVRFVLNVKFIPSVAAQGGEPLGCWVPVSAACGPGSQRLASDTDSGQRLYQAKKTTLLFAFWLWLLYELIVMLNCLSLWKIYVMFFPYDLLKWSNETVLRFFGADCSLSISTTDLRNFNSECVNKPLRRYKQMMTYLRYAKIECFFCLYFFISVPLGVRWQYFF